MKLMPPRGLEIVDPLERTPITVISMPLELPRTDGVSVAEYYWVVCGAIKRIECLAKLFFHPLGEKICSALVLSVILFFHEVKKLIC